MTIMDFNIFERIINDKVKCAVCFARSSRQSSVRMYDRDICEWCIDYYSNAFPGSWRKKIKLMLFF